MDLLDNVALYMLCDTICRYESMDTHYKQVYVSRLLQELDSYLMSVDTFLTGEARVFYYSKAVVISQFLSNILVKEMEESMG